MFSAANNTNKFCTATGGPVAWWRLLLAAWLGRWTARPVVSTLYALFFNLAPGLVAAPGISKEYSCA